MADTLLNGISEGANYGDDVQNNSDYPVARITNSGVVQYARTYNRSSTSMFTGTNVLTTEMTLPAGLLPGTYPLVIVANGNSSAAFPLTIAGTPLPPVTGLTFTTIASNQMALNWSAIGSTEAGYVVQRSANGSSFSTIASVSSNVTTYADNTVNPLTAYYYRVLGTNAAGLGNASQTVFAASPPVEALPVPWQTQDVGAVPGRGASGQAAGTYTVIGSGSIGGGSDQFQFASRPMVGDCTITARVTAESNTGANALAGVMIRSGLASSSADVFMAFGGGVNNSIFQSRAIGGGAAVSTAGPGSLNTPLWVQLVRTGNTITGYTSPNGSSWTQRGTVSVVMAPVVYAGLAVSSGASTRLNTATFDNVTVSGTSPLIASPLAYWKLDETSGATAIDSQGGYNGTYNNCALGQPGAAPATGTSAGFNGTNSSITIPALNLNNNVVTITAWVNCNGIQNGGAGILYNRANSVGTASGFHFGNANELRYTWNNLGYNFDSQLVVPTNQWTYVALVIEPTQTRLYMITNGVLVGATNDAPNAVQPFDGTSYIGQDPIGRFFKGQLDEVSFYANQSLTPEQLSQLASPPAITISSPLAGAAFAAPANVNLAAAVSGTNGHTIDLVQLFNNGSLVGQSATPPYTNTVTGLAAGSYALSARLFYDSGLALDSSVVNILVQNPAAVPQNVVATALASNLINVTWSSAANATGYILSRDGSPIARVPGLGYADFGLSANSNYCYSVVATNLISSSSASASSCATTPATGGALAWDANSSLTGQQDGSGNWSSNSATWWNGSATVNWADNNLAVFGVNTATNCTVTITNDVTPAGMVVNSTGGTYILTGDSNLVVVDNSTITVDGNAVITAPLAGTANFTKAGPGTLVLNNSSPSFNGTLSVNAGTLEMQNGPDAGATGYSVGTNGILRLGYNSAPNYGQAIVVNGGGVNSPNGLYLAGEPHSAGTASR